MDDTKAKEDPSPRYKAQEAAEIQEKGEETCSWGPLKPPCCRPLLSIKAVLLVLCIISALQSMMANSLVSVSITGVEKRFNIDSTDSGLIASCYDIASVICLIPVGYWGGHGSKPRWLGFGTLVMGVGVMLYSLPHFTTGLYKYTVGSEDDFCDVSLNASDVCSGSTESLSDYKYVLYLSQLLLGAGAAPLYTLGVTYLDDYLSPATASAYMGVFYATAVLGPALGFIFGGLLLSLYTDFYRVNDGELTIDEDSEAWVGAWWLGPLICGGLLVIIAVPMLGFPRRLPGWQNNKKQESEVYGGQEDTAQMTTGLQSIKEFPAALKKLLTNPTFIFISLGGALDDAFISGVITFLPKYIESQFSVTSSEAGVYVGIVAVTTGCNGMFIGGYIVKRFNLKVRGIIRLMIGFSVVALVASLVFAVRCDSVDFAGVSVTYDGRSMGRDASESTLKDACNANCSCSFETFAPVCGDDDVMYFNPCAAGCQVWDERSGKDRYDNCSCVAQASNGRHQGAKEGKCSGDCNLLGVFLPLIGIIFFCISATAAPGVSASLRCVPDKQRSFAMAIQWIIVRCVGGIPGPVIFGAAIDDSCIFDKKDCDGDAGACYYYDNDDLSSYFLGLILGGKILELISYIFSGVLYKPPPVLEETIEVDNGSSSSVGAGGSNPSSSVGAGVTNLAYKHSENVLM